MMYTLVVSCMIVRKTGRVASRSTQDSSKASQRHKDVMIQATFYVAAFWLTWLFGSLNRVYQEFGDSPFAIVFLHALFVPLQGFMNALVYFRPRC